LTQLFIGLFYCWTWQESLNPKKSAIQALNEILPNPNEKSQQSSSSDDKTKITEIHDMVKSLLNLYKRSSVIGHELGKGEERL